MTDQAEGQSPEDQMMALLETEEAQESGEVEEKSEAQTEEVTEVTEETTEEVEEEAEAQPTKLKLKWNGEEVEKDLDEVIALAQQGHDYTKKTQTLAEERKAIEEQAQAFKAQEQAHQEQVKLQQALIKEIADVTALDKQIAQYNNIDWNTLTDSDPVQAQKLFFQRTQLVDARNKAAQELNVKHQTIVQQQQSHKAELVAKAKAALLKDIPDWNDQKEAEAKEIAKSYGFKDEEFSSVIDARTMRMILDAGSFKKLKSNPVTQNKVVGKPPVVKPGSKDPSVVAKSKRAEQFKNLKKSGRMEDAAALIEQTL